MKLKYSTIEFEDRVKEIANFIEFITNLKKVDADKYHRSKDNLNHVIDSTGQTLLHYTVKMNDVTTTQWLLGYGLDIDAQTKYGETPLMIATEDNHEDMVKILLKANAKIDIFDNDGKTALERINFDCITKSTIASVMLMKLVDKCETEEEAATKLSNAKCPLYVAVLLKNSKITEFFLEKGVNVNEPMPIHRATALHFAVYFKDLKNVELLLNNGADINAEDRNGKTPLAFMSSYCCQFANQLKILQLLLDRGAHLTTWIRDADKCMQIYSILRFCSKEIVAQVLKHKNIDLYAKDGRNNTLLHYLAGNANQGVFELLQDRIIDVNASNDKLTLLSVAALSGHENSIQFLLDRGANVNCCPDEKGMTPLFNALIRDSQCAKEDIKCVELLIQYGAEIQITSHKFKVDSKSIQKVIFGRNLTIIDLVVIFGECDYLIEPVLAHLAMLEATGITIINILSSDINKYHQFKNSFNTYKHQLEQFKDIVICDSVTMFQLLTMSEKQFLIQLRNEKLVSKLEQDDFKNNEDIYYRKLRLRIVCAYRKMQLKELAVEALYMILQLPYNTHPIITDKICSYLNKQDLVLLGQI